MNDPRYMPENNCRIETGKRKPRELSVELRAAAVKFRSDYKKPQALRVVKVRNTSVDEELFVDCGMKYRLE